MNVYPGLDYWRFAPYLDVIFFDSYSQWRQIRFEALANRNSKNYTKLT